MDGAAAIPRRDLLSKHRNILGGYIIDGSLLLYDEVQKIPSSPYASELWTRVVLPLTH